MSESQRSHIFDKSKRNTAKLFNWIFCTFTTVLFLTGCHHRIVLQNLTVATLPPPGDFRSAEEQIPWDAPNSENDKYLMSITDEVEFSWKVSSNSSPMAISALCLSTGTTPNCGPCLFTYTADANDPAHELIKGYHPRISMAVLARTAGLIVAQQVDPPDVANPNGTLSNGTAFDLCDPASNNNGTATNPIKLITTLDLSKHPTWAAVKSAFSQDTNGVQNNIIAVHLVPHPERRVLPGDVVRATLLWQFVGDSTNPFAATQITSRIDSAGTGLLPGLSSPTTLLKGLGIPTAPPAPAKDPMGLAREWVSATDYSQFQVPLWRPAVDFGAQLTLEQASACLSAIWQNTDNSYQYSVMNTIIECRKHGLDENYYASGAGNPNRNNLSIRYHLEVDQFWTLIAEDGRSFEQPFVPGTTIDAGICGVLQKIGERECDVRQARNEETFAVVIPRGELGPSNSAPFWTQLTGHKKNGVFKKTLLAPGDTVRLSQRYPKLVLK